MATFWVGFLKLFPPAARLTYSDLWLCLFVAWRGNTLVCIRFEFYVNNGMLFKVGLPGSITLDHDKRPLYYYTLSPLSLPHYEPVSCVQFQHISHRLWIDILCFSVLHPERNPQCMWTCNGLVSLMNAWFFCCRNARLWLVSTHVRARYILHEHSCSTPLCPLTGLNVILVACSECIPPFLRYTRAPDPICPVFFMIRTYALWNNNRIILVVMLFTLFVSPLSLTTHQTRGRCSTGCNSCNHRRLCYCRRFIWFAPPLTTFAHIHSTFIVTISAIPGIRGCYQTSADRIYIMFILLLGFQLGLSPEINGKRKHARWLMFFSGLVSLTIIRAIQRWRVVNGPLYDILVKHNVVYYACAMHKSGHIFPCSSNNGSSSNSPHSR
jgi:hypothetical protein